MKKILFIVLLLFPLSLFATEIEVEGIVYEVISHDDKTVQVKSIKWPLTYSWTVIIPSKINYYGLIYHVKSIGSNAFEYVKSSHQNDKIENIVLPYGITSIESSAFTNCTKLSTITIPSSVISIGFYAFSGCSNLESITLGSHVQSIGKYAFDRCYNLTHITSLNAYAPMVYDETFRNYNYNATLSVPRGCIPRYQVNNYWGKFKNIEEDKTLPDSIFEVDGIYYSIISENDKTVRVDISRNKYGGDIEIPQTITRNGSIYKVTSVGDRAFYRCDYVTSISIPDGVVSLGESAFYHCINLRTLNIPNSVITVSDSTFYESGLESINLPNISKIGKSSFQGCTSLSSITIPNSVVYIGETAFMHCLALTSITIPNSVVFLGGGAFYGCNRLQSISISNKLTSIERETFCWCENLASITIPNSVTKIGDDAFSICSSLESVNLPSNLLNIGQGAFSNCSMLKSVYIPGKVTCIGEYAFSHCPMLNQVTSAIRHPFVFNKNVFENEIYNKAILYVPIGTKTLYQSVENWKRFTTILEKSIEGGGYNINDVFSENGVDYKVISDTDSTLCVLSATKESVKENYGELKIPSKIQRPEGTYKVVAIADSAFINQEEIVYVYIENGINSIGLSAFESCPDLLYVQLPNSVVEIKKRAFKNCKKLSNNYVYFLPDLLKCLEEEVFYGCEALQYIKTPTDIKTIERNAFYGCKELFLIDLSENVETIGISAFEGCKKLLAFKIPEKLREIPSRMCWGCSEIAAITFNDKLEKIGSMAFSNCTGLITLQIPKSVTTIGEGAFAGCTRFSNLWIPNSVTNIGDGAFQGCSGLASIQVENDNPIYDSRSYCNAIIETVTNTLMLGCENTKIPNSIKIIGNYAFQGCTGLTSITIPNSVNIIKYNAFAYCPNLSSITIPNSVTVIEDCAFNGFTGITNVISEIINPFEIGSHTFMSNTYTKGTLTVPAGTKAKYQATNYWNKFVNIVENEANSITNSFPNTCQFDVYNLNGNKLKSRVSSLDGLQRGIYIIDGKKVIK